MRQVRLTNQKLYTHILLCIRQVRLIGEVMLIVFLASVKNGRNPAS